MGEAQTPHFYDFEIVEPITKPQNQHYWRRQDTSNKSRKIPGTFLEKSLEYPSTYRLPPLHPNYRTKTSRRPDKTTANTHPPDPVFRI